MELISNRADYSGKLGDKRLERRAELLSNALTNSRTSVVHKATRDEAEQKGFYRFLNNDAVSEEQLIEALRSRCATNVQGRDVLVIEDSSSLGFSRQL
ncbi:transposase DNA-binding-containing protein [Agriterribacter sp.]|uniref:transposase DNA-binding-containing protein n=1 Tax=Agriterribacter sp. TaxID=2821509 RepID=UPI002D18CF80|nr:transposase DNA-binding-containing protein [Agriterribacter sp.]HRO47658.1 transposase DNA-binding-containing protein [Agriterribacter sp.]